MVSPSGDEAAEVARPGGESLHLPALSIAAVRAAAHTPFAVAPVRRDSPDAVFVFEPVIESQSISPRRPSSGSLCHIQSAGAEMVAERVDLPRIRLGLRFCGTELGVPTGLDCAKIPHSR